jgi:hypothetical protein
MRARADAAKQYEVTKLEDLRAEDPSGRWPRIVAVIDEFQYLFADRDAVATQAVQLLEDVARRGRSQGIHLVLASQDVSGIEAFWGKPAIFEQFILRVALPKASRVLALHNDVAASMPRFHAIVNHESGVKHGNLLARIPDATSRGTFDELQRDLWQVRQANSPSPRLFDGSHVPALAETPDYQRLRPKPGVPDALFGQIIDVAGSAARSTLASAPGRNLAVIGSSITDAASVLGAAALSVARQHIPDAARFTLCPLVPDSSTEVALLAERLRVDGHDVDIVTRDDVVVVLMEMAMTLTAARSGSIAEPLIRPHYLFAYGIDAAHALLEAKNPDHPATGLENLRTVLRHGPEHRTHVFGWWRGVSRLKATLPIASTDEIGPWVAFDVQGRELATALTPGQLINWSPRERRGLYFDRFAHTTPQVIIPFDIHKESDGGVSS